MGLVRMPSSRMYWETDTRLAPVADKVSRNRFLNIIAKLHFVENRSVTKKQQQDKLWKIRPWLNKFRENCLKLVPEEYNFIDEQMVPFKEKFSRIKQYMQNKPHKWGFTIWCRCGISGLLYDFDVYQGNGHEMHENSIGLSGDVVLQPCATLPAGKNYKAIADNFFTSMTLLCKRKERGILNLGTVRKNRLPGWELKDKTLKEEGRGSFDHWAETTHDICAIRWFDNRAVTLVSSYLGTEPADAVRIWDKKKKEHVVVPSPYAVTAYNNFMSGVDFLDSLISKYSYHMRSKRWYVYLF